ncbi:hypothetical protein, partial [Lysinibacillus sp. NPDC093688]|uniref:hypothetical protein n=1 Tax=Lysinibacillus sp. NPDC093688 TaxID=3390577 RepID=UPI003D048AE4
DNAFVTNILLLPLRCTALSHRKHLLPRRPQESAQSERKSIPVMPKSYTLFKHDTLISLI